MKEDKYLSLQAFIDSGNDSIRKLAKAADLSPATVLKYKKLGLIRFPKEYSIPIELNNNDYQLVKDKITKGHSLLLSNSLFYQHPEIERCILVQGKKAAVLVTSDLELDINGKKLGILSSLFDEITNSGLKVFTIFWSSCLYEGKINEFIEKIENDAENEDSEDIYLDEEF